MAVDAIARAHRFDPFAARFEGQCARGAIEGESVLILKPSTFMNESGRAVGAARRYHKIGLDHIVVFYDEIDLAPGRLRVKRGGGSAGHNGIRSIDQHVGNDFWRVRIGVGHPGAPELVHGYVLHDFAKAERAWLDPMIDAIAAQAGALTQGRADAFMSAVALALAPPKPRKPRPTGEAPT
jgi:PTH1 family peptidyl-tRNA hydrolase